MRKKIKTVLGEIEPSALGLTSMDDALFYDGSAACLAARKSVSPDFCPREWLPMRDDEPVSLQNVGMLQRSALLSQDAFRQTDEKALEKELRLYKDVYKRQDKDIRMGGYPFLFSSFRKEKLYYPQFSPRKASEMHEKVKIY